MINFSTILKKILIIFFFLILILILWISFNFFKPIEKIKIKYSVNDPVQILKIDGKSFRDLNKNNKLDIYEDYRLDSIIRSEDLLDQMNLEEKILEMMNDYGVHVKKLKEYPFSSQKMCADYENLFLHMLKKKEDVLHSRSLKL